MTRSEGNRFLMTVIIAVPVVVIMSWWLYSSHRQETTGGAEAVKAITANQLDQAARILEQALRDDPQQLDSQLLYVQVLRRLNRKPEAQAALARAMQMGLPEQDGLREAALLEAEEHFDQGGGTLQQLLEVRPNDVELLEVLGLGYARKQRFPQAERLFTHLLELQPERTDILLQRAHVRRGRKRFTEAAADFREFLRSLPEDFTAHLFLADCLLSDAQVAEAEVELFHCRKLRPERSEPLVPLATCAVNRGDLDQAEVLLNKARELDPSDLTVLQELGNLYLVQRRYDLVIPLFEQIVLLEPSHRVGHLKLAQALRQQGKLERAQVHERQYQKLEAEEEKAALAGPRVP